MSVQRSPKSKSSPKSEGHNHGTPSAQNRNLNLKRKADSEFTDFCKEMTDSFKSFRTAQDKKMDSLQKAVEVLTLQCKQVVDSNNEIERIFQEFKEQQDTLRKKVHTLEVECFNSKLKINKLEDQLEQIEKDKLKKVIEIRNIPHQENENLPTIVNNILKKLEVIEETNEPREIYRRGKDNAPIVVKFNTSHDKTKVIKAVKTYFNHNKTGKITTADAGVNEEATPIYVSERLTTKTKIIFGMAKKLVKEGIFKYCWIRNGVVMLRKSDGQTVYRVKNETDVGTLRDNEQLQV